MKRIFAILICISLIIVCVSCSSKQEKEDTSESIVDTAEVTAEPEEEELPLGTLSRGKIEGKRYFSAFSGIELEIGDTWSFSSDEEIADIVNIGTELIDASEFAKTVAENATVYDMMTVDAVTNSNIMIGYENLDITAPGVDISVDYYMDNLTDMLTKQEQVKYTVLSRGVAKICGEEYVRLDMLADFSGIEMNQYYYIRKIDNIMVSVSITAVNGVDISDIESMFIG